MSFSGNGSDHKSSEKKNYYLERHANNQNFGESHWDTWQSNKDILGIERGIREACVEMEQKRFWLLREKNSLECETRELVEKKQD